MPGTTRSSDCQAETTCLRGSPGTPRSPWPRRKQSTAHPRIESTRTAWSLRRSIRVHTRRRRRALPSAGTRPRKSTSRCVRSRRRRWSCAGRPGTSLQTPPQLESSTCWQGSLRRNYKTVCKCLPRTPRMQTRESRRGREDIRMNTRCCCLPGRLYSQGMACMLMRQSRRNTCRRCRSCTAARPLHSSRDYKHSNLQNACILRRS